MPGKFLKLNEIAVKMLSNIAIMPEYKRTIIEPGNFAIMIQDIPIDAVLFAASLGSQHVTVLELSHYHETPGVEITVQIDSSSLHINPKLLRYQLDLGLTQKEFIDLKALWHAKGCYAVFHESKVLKARPLDLEASARYKMLQHFGWTLELFIADPASSGMSTITSPNSGIIDKIEQFLKANDTLQ